MTVATELNARGTLCEALFASGLQRSSRVTSEAVAEAASWAVRRFGADGCAGLMAQEFGDHPEVAAGRMRWIRELVDRMPAIAPARLRAA